MGTGSRAADAETARQQQPIRPAHRGLRPEAEPVLVLKTHRTDVRVTGSTARGPTGTRQATGCQAGPAGWPGEPRRTHKLHRLVQTWPKPCTRPTAVVQLVLAADPGIGGASWASGQLAGLGRGAASLPGVRLHDWPPHRPHAKSKRPPDRQQAGANAEWPLPHRSSTYE